MGAIGYQNGDGTFIDSGSLQPFDYGWENLREACLPRRIRRDDGYRPTASGHIDECRAGQRLIEGGGNQFSRVATGRGTRRQRANPQPAKIQSQPVAGKGELDNHGVTIPSC